MTITRSTGTVWIPEAELAACEAAHTARENLERVPPAPPEDQGGGGERRGVGRNLHPRPLRRSRGDVFGPLGGRSYPWLWDRGPELARSTRTGARRPALGE